MATITVSKKGQLDSSLTISVTFTYSVSSTNTSTTITLSSVSKSYSGHSAPYVTGDLYWSFSIDNTEIWYNGDNIVNPPALPVTKKFNKTTSAQTKTIKAYLSENDGGTSTSGSNTATFSVPALASYAVSYNANGHGTAPSNQTKYYGIALTLKSAISATGYTFVRWNTNSNNTGTGYAGGASYTGNAALALYAIWNHSVTYNANGGSGAPSAQSALATAAITLTTTKPTRSNFTFKEWNTKSDGTGTTYASGGTFAAGSANVTLYAIWNRTVTYNANGGSGAPSAQTAIATSAITLSSTTPTKTGYTFKNWNTKIDNTGTSYNAGGTYAAGSGSVTLYAIWNRTVTYNANGGSGAPSSQTAIQTSAITLSSTKPTRSGYTFKTWNTNSSGTGTNYASGGTYAANNPSVTLYAIWNRTVTYNANGGSGEPSAQTAIATSAITLSSTIPVRDGYRFAKWNTNSSGTGTNYNSGGTYDANNPSVTLYAVWEKIITNVTIGSIKAIRTDSISGTDETDDGTFAYITVPITVQGMAAANVSMTITAVADSGDDPEIVLDEATATKLEDTSLTGVTLKAHASGCDDDVRYTFTATVTANNTTVTQTAVTATKSVILASAFFTIDVKAGGKGIHFGGAATEEGFYVSMPATFNSYLKKCIVNDDLSVTPSANLYNAAFYAVDKNGVAYGGIHVAHLTDDIHYIALECEKDISGTRLIHYIRLRIAPDGTRSVVVTEPSAWRNAIGAVYTGGDTMTGALTIKSSNIAHDTVPSSEEYGTRLYFTGSDNGVFGQLRAISYPSGTDGMQLLSYRAINGSNVYNILTIGVNSDGTRFVSVNEPATWRSALNVVNKSGDTITGGITHNVANSYFKSSNITRNTMASELTYGNSRINFQDKDGNSMAQLRPVTNTTYIGIELNTFKDGSTGNNLILAFDNNGNAVVRMSAPAAWRSALGLAADSSWTSVAPVVAKKQGNVVTVIGNSTHSNAIAASTWADVCTLPSGYRPSGTLYAAGMIRSAYPCVVRITSAGVVSIYINGTASAAGGSVRFSLAFVI